MDYRFALLDEEEVERIISWKYDGIYSFYDMEADDEDLQEFRENAANNKNYWGVYEANILIGFFTFIEGSKGTVEIGLGLSPQQVGIGKGYDFLHAGLQKAHELYRPTTLEMAVAEFNQRAINVYLKAGFAITHSFIQRTNGGEYTFIRMRKDSGLI
ncbi:GNAT family N-acetyltransferase [Pseudalkalibacillus hwajinpoensis]|uniref:GNAT family N-acetyltransferase n=1 Tax=Guptibacillus hwajinpoensis TaxID=208199 RepID=UPI00325A9B2D